MSRSRRPKKPKKVYCSCFGCRPRDRVLKYRKHMQEVQEEEFLDDKETDKT